MKLKFPLIAAFVAMLALTACGGGGDDAGSSTPPVSSPTALTKSDLTVGAGAEAVSGKKATVVYTLWLYSSSATDFKGKQLESNQFAFTLGKKEVIDGFEQGVTGMKVGGKRLIQVPASLAYGSRGNPPSVPPNAGVVFEITLNKIE